MRAYRCKSRFFCSPLKRYIPKDAIFGRYENITKLVMNDNPSTTQDPFGQLVDGIEYDDPGDVTWIYAIEPPPLGTNNTYFEDLGRKDEDEFGNVAGTADGLPSNSKLKIDVTSGVMYIQNVDTLLWHPLRITGPDGNAYLEIGQNGQTLP